MDKTATAEGLFFLAVIVAALSWAVLEAFSFAAYVQLTPIAIGLPTLIIATALLVREVSNGLRGKSTAEAEASEISGTDRTDREPRYSGGEVTAIAWFGIFVGSIFVLGSISGSIVFLVLFLKVHGKESWKVVLAALGAVFAVLYLLFVKILGTPLYDGYLSQTFGM